MSTLEEPHVLPDVQSSRRLKFTAMAGLGALLLGFAGLIGWEYSSTRVTRADDVSRRHRGPTFGHGAADPRGGQRAVGDRAVRALVEAIDTIRTMLLHGGPTGVGLRTILITSLRIPERARRRFPATWRSASPRAGFNVLLVDGDLQAAVRPQPVRSARKRRDFASCSGVRSTRAAAVRATPLPGLSVLPAGTVDLAARQSLIAARWHQIRHELEGRFDFLIIDTAPLLLVSDTLLFAREADGVILSVLLGVSRLAHLVETERRLRAVGARLAGIVVNGEWQDAHARVPGTGSRNAGTPPRCGLARTPRARSCPTARAAVRPAREAPHGSAPEPDS